MCSCNLRALKVLKIIKEQSFTDNSLESKIRQNSIQFGFSQAICLTSLIQSMSKWSYPMGQLTHICFFFNLFSLHLVFEQFFFSHFCWLRIYLSATVISIATTHWIDKYFYHITDKVTWYCSAMFCYWTLS